MFNLKEYVDFETVCPELEIGLGIPRDPVHLVLDKNKLSLFQPKTKLDLGNKMNHFSDNYIKKLKCLRIVKNIVIIKFNNFA